MSPRAPAPANAHRRSHPAPPPSVHPPLGIEQLEEAAHGQYGRAERERRQDRDQHADSNGRAERFKIRKPGKAEAIHGAGNGQTRTQDHVGGPVKHRVEGRFPILAGVARFVVTAEHEYRVVRARRNRHENEQVGRKC